MQKRNTEQKALIVATIKKRMALKPNSLRAYSRSIVKFCDETQIKPFDFPKIGLEEIEDLTETYILTRTDKLAPKYLNLIYNAIKTWCFALRMIKNRRLFREIKFDKQSRKTDAMTEQPLETTHVKKLFMICNAQEKLLAGLYGLCAFRPSIIPQLQVKDIHVKDYIIESGKIKITAKNPFLCVPSGYEGNKSHKIFFVIVPSKIKELLEYCLNLNGVVTKKTPLLGKYKSEDSIYQKMKQKLLSVGFEGRPYSLRSFGSRLFARTLRGKQPRELKEFMMGHKGTISTVYEKRALTQEDKIEYLDNYVPTEQWINEKIFGARSQEELSQADMMKRFALGGGVSPEKAQAIYDLMKDGKMRMTEYEDKIRRLMNTALETKMRNEFEKMFLEMQAKHNENH